MMTLTVDHIFFGLNLIVFAAMPDKSLFFDT